MGQESYGWRLFRFAALLLLTAAQLHAAEPAPPHALPAAWQEDEANPADALAPDAGVGDLADLDIEQLGDVAIRVPSFDVEVTSVTRHEGTIGRSPAAVFVITQEMIRRSGTTSVPELLRMVPGLQVARIDANKWAISSRGFNDRFANKLLVLIDGRSVYTPSFSGVYWDVQDLVLQDIERIEVIRGPGASLWGANAVNGVINIISKSANDTQGLMVAAGAGDQDKSINAFRYGGEAAGGGHYRVYGKHFERATGYTPSPLGAADDWRQGRVGFRADWPAGDCDCDRYTVQGELYSGVAGERLLAYPLAAPPFVDSRTNDATVSGGFLRARWDHRVDETSSYYWQLYYDRANRNDIFVDQAVNIFDVEFQHLWLPSDRHTVTWGAHYRLVADEILTRDLFFASADPEQRQANLISGFLQDEITLHDALSFVAGCKFEHNDYSGFEYQPSGRLLWAIDNRHAAWGAVSRAVRTPSRAADDLSLRLFAAPPFVFGQLRGTRQIEAEDLMAYEIGYRAQPNDSFSWDVAAFYNVYEDLIVHLPTGPPAGLPPTVPLRFTNAGSAESYGVEVSGQWLVSEHWRLSAWYSFLRLHARGGLGETTVETASPHNQAWLMSSWDLAPGWEFDAIGRYVDSAPGAGARKYLSLDLRLGWQPSEQWELSVVGQNLLDSHRAEFPLDFINDQPTEVSRGVYAQAVWRR